MFPHLVVWSSYSVVLLWPLLFPFDMKCSELNGSQGQAARICITHKHTSTVVFAPP